MVSDYLCPPLPHTLLIRGTMEKWPFQHYNMPLSFSAVQQAMRSVRAGQLTEHFAAALSSDALKSARNLRLHFICFHCEMPPPQITSDNLTYMSRLRRHVKLHVRSGPCQRKEKMPSLTTTVQTWGVDQRLCLEIKLVVAKREYGIQEADLQAAACCFSHPLERPPVRRGWTLLRCTDPDFAFRQFLSVLSL